MWSLLSLLLACGFSEPAGPSPTADPAAGDSGAGSDGGGQEDPADGGGGDGGISDGGSSDGGGSAEPSFEADLWPLYAALCSDCHEYWGSSAAQVHALLTGDVYQPPLVIPGDPQGSAFYRKLTEDPIEGARMPLSPEPFTAEELEELESWIDRGAPEEELEPAFGSAWRSEAHRCQMCHADWEMGTTLYEHLSSASAGDYALLVAGDPEASLVYLKVQAEPPPVGASMPPSFDYLDETQQALVREWIEAGAPP